MSQSEPQGSQAAPSTSRELAEKVVRWTETLDGGLGACEDGACGERTCNGARAHWHARELLSQIAEAEIETERLRDALQWCAEHAWEGDICGGDLQDEMVRRGVMLRVPPTEAEQSEHGLEPDDSWYVLAWSPRAKEP